MRLFLSDPLFSTKQIWLLLMLLERNNLPNISATNRAADNEFQTNPHKHNERLWIEWHEKATLKETFRNSPSKTL